MASRTTELSTLPTAHGKKRLATDDLEREQRFAKRFDLLSLDHNGKLYIPISTSPEQNHHATKGLTQTNTSPRPRSRHRDDDHMQVEDDKHRVYILDLDKELSDVESDDEHPIFLPDIEKHLSKIPQHVLRGRDADADSNNQLILYSDPKSLTVPKEQDSVRKAVLEARARLREAQLSGAVLPTKDGGVRLLHEDDYMRKTPNGYIKELQGRVDDPDAMDMD